MISNKKLILLVIDNQTNKILRYFYKQFNSEHMSIKLADIHICQNCYGSCFTDMDSPAQLHMLKPVFFFFQISTNTPSRDHN